MIYKDISKQMESLRKKLYLQIEKHGIESNQALRVSEELDFLIEEFYRKKNIVPKYSIFKSEYEIAYEKLKYITMKMGVFPSIKNWNAIAKEEIYLCNKSIEYISGLNWDDLKSKIRSEI